MKFVFFGTPEFAAIILEKLINAGFIPEAVVCNPDRPIGRKKIITSPPVKKVVRKYVESNKYDIKVFQPETSKNLIEIKPLLLATNTNLLIIAAYAKIIPKEILEIPRLGAIGIHPSLLPKYRGPSPIQSAILNGDEITGTTLFLMDEKIDHGPILAQRELNYGLGIMNYELLMKKLAEFSADLLVKILPDIKNKIKNTKPQNESKATYTKKFTIKDTFIEPADLAAAQQGGEPRLNGREKAIIIDRKIRAFNPEPGTWTFQQGLRLSSAENLQNKLIRIKLLEAEITKDNKLKLKKIQIEGKKVKTL